MTQITPDIIAEHGLSETEYGRIVKHLDREPNLLELGVFSVMWSEHCSYKSSRRHLKKLPTDGPQVIQGPGENAGVVDIGDGQAVVFKMESHNHPSFIEPYQGAATGVGGIMRDVFTMGARPIANMNALRFGALDHPKTKHLVSGVVAGIGGYGNCMGVPTVGGETNFHAGYNGNILVNAMCVGLVEADKIFYSAAKGAGNPVVYVGSKTGRDGIHGATMASAEFDDASEEKRPTVQVGDPFTEKLLLEACLELMAGDTIIAIQDMGAAGLTSSSVEMASKGEVGIELTLDHVPQREEGMTPYEMMLSESQERMLMVLKPGAEAAAKAIFDKWELDFAVIGKTTDTGRMVLTHKGETVADMPVPPLADDAPNYDRPFVTGPKPEPLADPEVVIREALITLKGDDIKTETDRFIADKIMPLETVDSVGWSFENGEAQVYVRLIPDAPLDGVTALAETAETHEETVNLANAPGGDTLLTALAELMESPDLCARRWIWEQYDHTVMGDTVQYPGGDAGVVRVHGSDKGIAISTDVTPRYCKADPHEGGKQAVAEVWRNLTATGATPLAVTDCLNFGNPERPEIMAQFVGCIEGMAEACAALSFPVVSGNVSLYNETNGEAIPPTPAIGGVGLLPHIDKMGRMATARAGDVVLALGVTKGWLGQSLYMRELFGREDGAPPPVDLEKEKKAGDFVRELIGEGKVAAVHDVSDGGLLVAIAEMCLAAGQGAKLETPVQARAAAFWFGEDQGRYVLSAPAEEADNLILKASMAGVQASKLGTFGGEDIALDDEALPVLDLHDLWDSALPAYMSPEEQGAPAMAMDAATIEQMIKEALPDAEVEIIDLAGDGDHYKARVVSKAFEGKTRVQQHQLVYAALKGKMGGELHALALETAAS
ncbi:MAG: phosphoribosylformylglycinamidine synthase subunit PurL [Pseudomonadota bacterium]